MPKKTHKNSKLLKLLSKLRAKNKERKMVEKPSKAKTEKVEKNIPIDEAKERRQQIVSHESIRDERVEKTLSLLEEEARKKKSKSYQKKEDSPSYDPGLADYSKKTDKKYQSIKINYQELGKSAYKSPEINHSIRIEARPAVFYHQNTPVQAPETHFSIAPKQQETQYQQSSHPQTASSSHNQMKMKRPCGGRYHKFYHDFQTSSANYIKASV